VEKGFKEKIDSGAVIFVGAIVSMRFASSDFGTKIVSIAATCGTGCEFWAETMGPIESLFVSERIISIGEIEPVFPIRVGEGIFSICSSGSTPERAALARTV
jgi:hypothetical protein